MAVTGFAEDIVENSELHFIFVGGKGGVGKTTTSSALASQLCYDRRVLIISTDPAHSLGDAFRQQFVRGEPTEVEGLPNLHVLEVNPEKFLRTELDEWAALAQQAGVGDLVDKLKEFQEWLTGIPGIDEAVALTSVIGLIENGEYDVVVFDTAPTGHTVKLLGLPSVLQLGLEKLQSWQTTIWMYWQTFQAFSGVQSDPEDIVNLRQKVEDRLQKFKEGVEQVGAMMRDSRHTVFVVVCIAEHLSISESQRLLGELKRQNVRATHVVVNQLVQGMSEGQIAKLEDQWPVVDPGADSDVADVWQAVKQSVQLLNARQNLQQGYLSQLRSVPEVAGMRIIEVPLLPYEVAGPSGILDFSQNLVPRGYRTSPPRPLERKRQAIGPLYPHLLASQQASETASESKPIPSTAQASEPASEAKPKANNSSTKANASDKAKASEKEGVDAERLLSTPPPPVFGVDSSGYPPPELAKAPPEELVSKPKVVESPSTSSSAVSDWHSESHAAKSPCGIGGFSAGDAVVITGLAKTPHYNNLRGYVTDAGRSDSRLSVAVQYEGSRKMLLLKSENLEPDIEDAEEQALLSDPELVKLMANPRLLTAYEEVREHPESLSTHLKDPEIGPAIERAMRLLSAAGRPAAATD